MFRPPSSGRPSRSTRQTTMVSPASAHSSSFFIPGRSIAVRLPVVTSANKSRLCMAAVTSGRTNNRTYMKKNSAKES